MSPQTALHSEIFRNYFFIMVAVLAAAGIVLSLLRWGLKKNVLSIWATYRSWLIMAPLMFGCVFAGRVTVIVCFCLVAAFGFKEFARATGLYRDWWMTAAVYIGIAAVGVTSLIHQPQGKEPGNGWYGLFIVLPVYVIALILFVPIVRNRVEGQLQTMSLAILGFIYIGWMFGHLIFLANATNAYGYLLYIVFATEINDVAAFTFGKLFGRHPFRSNISPKKTWEGSLGALAVSMVLPWALRFSFPQFGTTQLILTGLIVGIGGQLGDLAISVIKRDIGIKDMGAGIPGHGGLLDRMDSLIYTAPLFFHMTRYFYGLS
ncbi:MAG TPA: phosphatidate cytidylyltransferase [Verrucomicrobiae bacterium]|nr:phosphatidate cytidylyltransferase [Verrucomicrobiae bacterium]